MNRMEVGKGGVVTAQKEVQEKYGFPVASIVSMAEVVECLYNKEVEGDVVINDDIKAAIDQVLRAVRRQGIGNARPIAVGKPNNEA